VRPVADRAGRRAKARAWTIVRAADYWLLGLDHGFTEDPVRCHRLLDALAR
jgi:streptomycin 6-kinase